MSIRYQDDFQGRYVVQYVVHSDQYRVYYVLSPW
jgi:hypothetical protein